jgi:YfiH family protein
MSVKFHFFGKDCSIDRALSNRSDLNKNIATQGFDCTDVLFVNQIHGTEVVVVDAAEKIHGQQNLPKADAIVTNLPNLAIAVVTADCSPILFYDEAEKVIAVAHAGWRGAKLGVIDATVAAMKNLGAKKIHAIVGPMIQQASYEVSEEFLKDFLSEKEKNKKFFNAGNLGKYWFDLPSYVEEKLVNAGISLIKNLKVDTYKNEKDFFSFRRSTHLGEKDCGRNVSVIALQ